MQKKVNYLSGLMYRFKDSHRVIRWKEPRHCLAFCYRRGMGDIKQGAHSHMVLDLRVTARLSLNIPTHPTPTLSPLSHTSSRGCHSKCTIDHKSFLSQCCFKVTSTEMIPESYFCLHLGLCKAFEFLELHPNEQFFTW